MSILQGTGVLASDTSPDADQLTMVRRLCRESIILLGGGRATLLQIAHPLIAAGVSEHSYFRNDPLRRLDRTMRLMLTLVFGSPDQVHQALRQFNAVHRQVNGTLSHAQGQFTAGTPYRAEDPSLKLWVQATLIDTSLLVYHKFIGPLTEDERARFYEESKIIGGWLGIPYSLYPPFMNDFDRYMQDMLNGNTLTVTETARDLARAVMYPKAGVIPRSSIRLLLFATAWLLPPHLRDAYRLPWRPAQQRMLGGIGNLYRILRPLTPPAIALMPQAGGGQLVQFILEQYHPES